MMMIHGFAYMNKLGNWSIHQYASWFVTKTSSYSFARLPEKRFSPLREEVA